MPTERFYRLPEKKRQLIREAAIREFARVPFEKASINQIIRNAEISRGSFYTYFEDKLDVIRYIFEDSGRQMRELCDEELTSSGGDYFAMLNRVFEYFVDKVQDTGDMLNLVRNVFSYEQTVKMLGLTEMDAPMDLEGDCENIHSEMFWWLYDRIDKKGLLATSKSEFAAALTLGTFSLLSTIRRYYYYPEQVETIRKEFYASLKLLKRGMYKDGP